jgi:hypothetical protein
MTARQGKSGRDADKVIYMVCARLRNDRRKRLQEDVMRGLSILFGAHGFSAT